jgi:hypothetical protein
MLQTGLGKFAWRDTQPLRGRAQPRPTRSTPHRSLFLSARFLTVPRLRAQSLHPLPPGEHAGSVVRTEPYVNMRKITHGHILSLNDRQCIQGIH